MINKVEFLKSVAQDEIYPPKTEHYEIAFFGRSNVGKSSLLNLIFNNRKMVKVSSKPGKTKLLNYFIIDKKYYLIDVPGYGFAKMSKKEKKQLDELIYKYLTSGRLKKIFIIIDVRRGILPIDEELVAFLNEQNIQYQFIINKIDKISNNELQKVKNKLQMTIPKENLNYTSVLKKRGVNELINKIYENF